VGFENEVNFVPNFSIMPEDEEVRE
jgi:hypothetical protein